MADLMWMWDLYKSPAFVEYFCGLLHSLLSEMFISVVKVLHAPGPMFELVYVDGRCSQRKYICAQGE